MVYVLDANVIIHYLRNNLNVRTSFRQAVSDGHELFIPRPADYEVCRGLEILGAAKKTIIYNEMTGPEGHCKIVDLGENIWERAKKIYVGLYRKGFTVGEIDILIGAFCLQHDYTLVTANTKDFKNMERLRFVNWWSKC